MNLYENIKSSLREDENTNEVDEDNFANLENLYKKVVSTARVLWDKLTVLEGIDCSPLLEYSKLPKETRRAIAQKVGNQFIRVYIGSPIDDYTLINYAERKTRPEWSVGYDETGKQVALMSVSHGSMGYLASKKSISVRSEHFNQDVERGDYDNLMDSDINEVKNKLEEALNFIKSLLNTTDRYEDEYFYYPRSESVPGFGRRYEKHLDNGRSMLDDDYYFYIYLDDYARGKTSSISKMSDDEILKMYDTLKKAINSNLLKDRSVRLDPDDEEYANLKHYLPIMKQILKDRNLPEK